MIEVLVATMTPTPHGSRAPVDLSQLESLPSGVLEHLSEHDSLFKRTAFVEDVMQSRSILAIAHELNDLCMDRGIVGYHFTRAEREEIASKGLLIESGEERRARFLIEHGHRLSADDLAELKKAWHEYFDEAQDDARDNRVWFTTTLEILSDRGADRLLSYFGGEVVFMPVARSPRIAKVLGSLGESLVVVCHLDASKAHTFMDSPWGRVLVSTYHRKINRRAHRLDLDIFQECSLEPSRILRIHRAPDLGWAPENNGPRSA